MAKPAAQQLSLFEEKDLLTLTEAAAWASELLSKTVSESNISYLVQYGKVQKLGGDGATLVSKTDLERYYAAYHGGRREIWDKQLGADLNWALSFDKLREKDTTKHVHRLHPYKGKFIPQLVQYFIDNHIDEFKKESFFKPGDIILDPFCGSGTALVQANEQAMHAIGIDISSFNVLIANCKVARYNLGELLSQAQQITTALENFERRSPIPAFEKALLEALSIFNNKHFPTPGFRFKVTNKEVDEEAYAKKKERLFRPIYESLVAKHRIQLSRKTKKSFLDTWYLPAVRDQIEFAANQVKRLASPELQPILQVILSRTIRSCRATRHSDLATLKEPQITSYYCVKHKKICKPLFSIVDKWKQYSLDTLCRLEAFYKIRTQTHQQCLLGDARTVDIFSELDKVNEKFGRLAREQKIRGIFSSPPYVGLIDYHEQHAYAYELFSLPRLDKLEIGPLWAGTGKKARETYVDGIAAVLINCKQFLVPEYDVFLVANDKHNLFPIIAEKAGMRIVNQFKRPVLNRTERDKGAFCEIIFHLKSKSYA
jgi:hypothetical protein